jgi:hypothetical protein
MDRPESKQYTKEQFIEMYNRLCKITGYALVAHPEFKYRDDGTFSVVVVFTIEGISKPDDKA